MKRWIFILGSLMVMGQLAAQNCTLSTSLHLFTQEQVDQFPINYPNCTAIEGNIIVDGDDITNLNGLNQLTEIDGTFNINYCPSLTSLAGLDNLSWVKRILIHKNDQLVSLSGLDNLQTVEQSLIISENNQLPHLEGLGQLESIGDKFTLLNNAALSSLTGLESSITIETEVELINNPVLTNIDALQIANALNRVTIIDNISLAACGENAWLCEHISNITFLELLNNAPGCNSVVAIEGVCGGMAQVFHPVFHDLNGNKIVDSGEPFLTKIRLDISPLGIQGVSNPANGGMTYLEPGNYTLTFDPLNNVGWNLTTDSQSYQVVLNTVDDVFTTAPFGLSLLPNYCLYEGGLTFSTQQEIDDFPINHPNCFGILGDVLIEGTSNDQIVNLNGLSQITYIGGSLDILANTNLESLTGLNNLTTIEGSCRLHDLGSLSDLIGLNNLQEITGNLEIRNLSELINLNGLDQLTLIGGDFDIHSNPLLNNLEGLESLTTIERDFDVTQNNELINFDGLNNLNFIGRHLRVQSCSNILNFNGLESLNQIVGSAQIAFLPNLISFQGLNNLNSITVLQLLECGALLDLSGMSSLSEVQEINIFYCSSLSFLPNWETIDIDSLNTLTVWNNQNLSVCATQFVCDYLDTGKPIFMVDNDSGCDSIPEVQFYCDNDIIHQIYGNVYHDLNENCLSDMGEQGFSNWIMEADGDKDFYTTTDDLGNYTLLTDSGTYIINTITSSPYWTPCKEDVEVICGPTADSLQLDFAVIANAECPYLIVDIGTPLLRRCFENTYQVRYCNLGTIDAEDSYIEIEFDPYLTVNDASIDYEVVNGLYQFDSGTIPVNNCDFFTVNVTLDCDSTILGQTHCVEAHIYPDSLCIETNPEWSGASLDLTASCVDDEVNFIIKNVGDGNMDNDLNYIVIEDHIIMAPVMEPPLGIDQQISINLPANGSTYRLEAQQIAGHPNPQDPNVAIEGCTSDTTTFISLGFITLFPENDGSPFVSIDCQENIGSWDPNDKLAYPQGYADEHFIEANTDIEYRIRFQNTGTDTAFNIVIVDTISSYLDLATLRPGASSYPYDLDIGPGNVIRFSFSDIMLPDSNVNEAASHGFVKFKIAQQRDNPIGTLIENEADIYFDFNEPVLTNQTWHTIGTDFIQVSTQEIILPGVVLKVYPNPFIESTTFEIKGKQFREIQLRLFDTFGRLVRTESFTQTSFQFNRTGLTTGIYFYELSGDGVLVGNGKVMVY